MADCIHNLRVTHLDFQVRHQPKKNRSNVVKVTENMRNELKRMKYQFSDFYFLSYGRFLYSKTTISH